MKLLMLAFFTTTALAQNEQVITDGTDPVYEFRAAQILAPENAREQLTVAKTIPAEATNYQADVIAAYGRTHSPKTHVVGVYGQVVCAGARSSCWGLNSVTISEPGAPSAMISTEVNMNANNKDDHAYGILYAGGSTVTPENSIAELFAPMGTLAPRMPWNYGTVYLRGAANHPVTIFPSSTEPTAPSGEITLVAYKDDQPVPLRLQAQPNGSLTINGVCVFNCPRPSRPRSPRTPIDRGR